MSGCPPRSGSPPTGGASPPGTARPSPATRAGRASTAASSFSKDTQGWVKGRGRSWGTGALPPGFLRSLWRAGFGHGKLVSQRVCALPNGADDLAHPSAVRLIPDCRVSVDGKKLDVAMDARLTKVEVDLDVDLFGQCVLVFNDPAQALINGKEFQSGTPIKVEIGFGSKLKRVFEGEVVALEPQFRRDMAPSLRVVCQESLHRLALSQMTRAFNDVDDKEIVGKIATEHGLSGEAPAGSKQHVLQGNITDAVFLRRLAQKHGNHLRIEGKKLIIGPPPKGAQLTIGPGDGTRKVKVKIQSQDQVEEITVHGYDPKTKKEFVGKAKGQGVTGEGTKKYGKGKTLSFAGQEHQPADTATAEAMAKGRMRKLSEGHVTATIEAIGDPGMLPGATVKL